MIYRIVTLLNDVYELGEPIGASEITVEKIQSDFNQATNCYRVTLSNGNYIEVLNPVEVWSDPSLQLTGNLPKP